VVVVGIVGYCGFVSGYPLGPRLMQGLRAGPWPEGSEVTEMNWGPLAIVQDFQARGLQPERVVLIGGLDRGRAAGTVSCRRWAGGRLDADAVQRRMFEAVTGVVSLDNLLVIGAHFGIWPAPTYTVELQWPASGLGDLVLAEAARAPGRVVGSAPLDADGEATVARIVHAARSLALEQPPPDVQALTAAQLGPVAPVLHPRFQPAPS
jgi:hypothetical protein